MATSADIAAFTAALTPYAQQAGQQLGVDPNIILGQWAIESGWGTSSAAQGNNFAGLTVAGEGTGFRTYATPADFEAAFVGNIQRMHPGALGTGSDLTAYTNALAAGSGGSYFGAQTPGSYAANVAGAMGVNGAVITASPGILGGVVGKVMGGVASVGSALVANIGLVAFGLVLVALLVQAGAKGVQRG